MLKKLFLLPIIFIIICTTLTYAANTNSNQAPIQTPETNFKIPIRFSNNTDAFVTRWINELLEGQVNCKGNGCKIKNGTIKTAKLFLDTEMKKPGLAIRVEDRLYCGSGGCSTFIVIPDGRGSYSILFDAVTHNISFSNRNYNTWAGILTNDSQYEWGFSEDDFIYVPLQ